jgi:hypothetical protein
VARDVFSDPVVCENPAEAGSPDNRRIDVVGGGYCLGSLGPI